MDKLFLARDKNGELNLYVNTPPIKGYDIWHGHSLGVSCTISQSLKDFPGITWEDKKPTEVMLVPCSSTIPTFKTMNDGQ